jgi:hypothetical protein
MVNSDGNNVDPSVIQACLAEYTQVDTEMKRLAQRQAALLKRYENQGVNVRSIKTAHRAGKLDGAAARAQAQSDMRYLIITGILKPADDDWVQTVSQSSLFEGSDASQVGVVAPGLANARAHADGYNSGKSGGLPGDNHFTPGTSEYVQWEAGRKEGAADRANRPGAAKTKVASVEPKPRGRPPGKRKGANGEARHA